MSAEQPTVQYRDVPGFPGYRVGDDGSVWSCRPRNGIGGFREWRRLKPVPHENGGHHRVTLRPGHVNVWVHHLVLEAFVGPCPAGMQGCHKDGKVANNALSNLRWGTPKSNVADSIRHGTYMHGERHGRAVLTTEQVIEIRRLAAQAGFTQARAAKQFKVCPSQIQSIVSRRTWKHV